MSTPQTSIMSQSAGRLLTSKCFEVYHVSRYVRQLGYILFHDKAIKFIQMLFTIRKSKDFGEEKKIPICCAIF